MVKRKNRAKRSLSTLPKGLPSKKNGFNDMNPFELAARNKNNKRPKHAIVNRPTGTAHAALQEPSALARALQKRQTIMRERLQTSKKANVFQDRRIGEYDGGMTADEQNLARLVRERSSRSKRNTKYSLGDNNGGGDDDAAPLTHKGRKIDSLTAKDHVILSDDEDEIGNLDAIDTEMHFGGGGGASATELSAYGPSGDSNNMSQQYVSRKTELDDLILRRKIQKAERMKSKEEQVETVEAMDESFKELAALLSFRDKEKDIRQHIKAKRAGKLSTEDQEMADWDKEMKQYQFMDRKVQATDRTKMPEEIAKEEAERLHKFETRRLARMSGDFDDDDFSDIESDEEDNRKKNKRKRKKARPGPDQPEALDGSDADDESKDELQTRFTSEGLVQVDKSGTIVAKKKQQEFALLEVGARVTASYRAKEQFGAQASWFNGEVKQIHTDKDGEVTYNVDYDDGDFEDGVEARHIRPIDKTKEELDEEAEKLVEEFARKAKRLKAKDKARAEIPFVFEVPTTLDALHDMIASYATTGKDASLIIQRIYAANTVRLDRRNMEKMQNFYDVLLRRFVAVGDAIHQSGDGGAELGRFKQLDALTKVMYAMAQDSAESAGAVWSRRLGIFQNAHGKRLRDAEMEMVDDEEDFTAWPSLGVFFTLKALGHIFPVTDQRHHIVTPAILLLSQWVVQTPVLSMHDVVQGTLCSGLLIEYTREAKRIAPEALAFLAGVIRLFAHDDEQRLGPYPMPSLEAAARQESFASFRSAASQFKGTTPPLLSFEKSEMEDDAMPAALLFSVLHLVERLVDNLAGSVNTAEKELLAEITDSLLTLKPTSKKGTLPSILQKKVVSAAAALSKTCQLEETRVPVQHRSGPTLREKAIKTLAPRLENPDKYSLSKDKGKSSMQSATDRTRREYRREHKAVARELRMDGAFVENERRTEQDKKDSAARDKRQKNFAWLQEEQGAMNQQVRLGGDLIKGGGMGAAKAKVKSAKMGIKKGGKF